MCPDLTPPPPQSKSRLNGPVFLSLLIWLVLSSWFWESFPGLVAPSPSQESGWGWSALGPFEFAAAAYRDAILLALHVPGQIQCQMNSGFPNVFPALWYPCIPPR